MSTYARRTTEPNAAWDLQSELAWFHEAAPTWSWKWASTFAKTAPHAYVMKGRHLGPVEYERAVRLALVAGQPRRFWKSTNVELHLPEIGIPYGPREPRRTNWGCKFWAMANRMSVSKAFNMAPVELSYGVQDAPVTTSAHRPAYDALAPDWDDMRDEHLGLDYDRGNHPLAGAIWKRVVGDHVVTGLLDVGCRTGNAVDLRLVDRDPARYTALDPSQAMLNQVAWKNRWAVDLVPRTAGELLATQPARIWDTIVSLLGSASYLTSTDVRSLWRRATGTAVFMHYREDAPTDFFGTVTLPDTAAESRAAAAGLPGAVVESLGEFQLVTVRGGAR